MLHYVEALNVGDPCSAIRSAMASKRHFEQLGNQRLACMCQRDVSYCLRNLGLYEPAAEHLRHAIETFRYLEAHSMASVTMIVLAETLVRRGDPANGLLLLTEAATGPLEVVDTVFMHIYSGQARFYCGNPEEGLREVDRALELSSSSRFPEIYAFAVAVRGQILLSLDLADEALEAMESILPVVASIGHLEEGDALLHLVHAEALHACGDLAAAGRAIATARDRLLTRAARIDDAEWKTSFLECVAENRRTLELARLWLGE